MAITDICLAGFQAPLRDTHFEWPEGSNPTCAWNLWNISSKCVPCSWQWEQGAWGEVDSQGRLLGQTSFFLLLKRKDCFRHVLGLIPHCNYWNHMTLELRTSHCYYFKLSLFCVMCPLKGQVECNIHSAVFLASLDQYPPFLLSGSSVSSSFSLNSEKEDNQNLCNSC